MLKYGIKRAALTTTLVAIAGLGTGCVSQGEYDKLWETNRSLTNRNAELQGEVNSMNTANSALTGSAGNAGSVISQLQNDNASLRSQLMGAQSSLSGIEDRMNSLSIVSLDAATDRALRDLAAQYPDMIVYDADRSMLLFASDLTFGSGSDSIQSSAGNGLATLAGVLNAGAAAGYDIQIVGHTDDEKPGSNTRRNHPTNMHLAAHRAIAVRNALGNAGVPWERMSAMGWGEHRPVVANNVGKGTAANRRVEIFLVNSTSAEFMTTDAPVEIDTYEAPASTGIDPTK
ncbi:MAG: OmpA family protein [Phycisphaerales bacterium]|nr:OmpA family protein [Phycisphaerales bacterium]